MYFLRKAVDVTEAVAFILFVFFFGLPQTKRSLKSFSKDKQALKDIFKIANKEDNFYTYLK